MNFQQILMAAATQGGGAAAAPAQASWPSLIGAEMMVNGDCSSGTGWNLATGTVVAAGKMTMTTANANTVGNSGVNIDTLIDGATYRNVFTIDTVSLGSVQLALGGTFGTSRSTTGTFSQDIVYTYNDDNWLLIPTTATMQLDNFSVKSVGANGQASDWSFTGDGSFASGGFVRTNGSDIFSCSLAGAAATAFDAAVSSNTACTVSFTEEPGYSGNGQILVSLKGGVAVAFDWSLGVTAPRTVTSGSGSGFKIESGDADVSIALIQITLA